MTGKLGGGFAGLALARKLNNQAGIEVLLLDRLTYHQFPFPKLFHGSKNVRIRITEVLEYFTSDQSLRLARRFKGKFSNIETDLIN